MAYDEEILHPEAPDIAVAIGLTHDIGPDVLHFARLDLPSVGRLLTLSPAQGAGAQSVACGRHACELAESAVRTIRQRRPAGSGTVHLFIAAPNAFTFFLGQRQQAIGATQLYEFDFEGGRNRSYSAALRLPLS